MQNATERDQVLDRATNHVEEANTISPNNDEVEVLHGYALMARLVVDPSTRGQKYTPLVMQKFGKAMAMNPDNPRAAALMARQQLGTAQFFGSDSSEACGLAKRSIALFDREQTEGFGPSWGRNVAEGVLGACKEKE